MNTKEQDDQHHPLGDSPDSAVPAAVQDSARQPLSTGHVDFSTEKPKDCAYFYANTDEQIHNPEKAQFLQLEGGKCYSIRLIQHCPEPPLHYHVFLHPCKL